MAASIKSQTVTGGAAVKQFSSVSVPVSGVTVYVSGLAGQLAWLGFSSGMTMGTVAATDGIPCPVGESRFFPAADLADLNALYVGTTAPAGVILSLTAQGS
jgi:hypothetical protein